jgi:hypothetical protein
MASEKTVFSKSGDWKIEVEAWRNHFIFYQSIGTQVDVYHKEKTTDTWGNDKIDWVKKNANSISITNRYFGSDPVIFITRSKVCNNSSHCELKEWAVGTITLSDTGLGVGASQLIVTSVKGSVSVNIGNEILSAEVEASSFFSDSSIW